MTKYSSIPAPNFRAYLALGGFLALVIGVGGTLGALTAPGDWYASLNKPPFNPPNWIFAPVWLVLYIAIAVAGWRAWRAWRADPKSTETKLWIGQLLLNWLWSPTFFSFQQLWAAFAVISVLWLTIAAFIHFTWHGDRIASYLFMPYFAWVSFAAVLNFSVAYLN